MAIVDSGPLYAVVDADDNDHHHCVQLLERTDFDLVVPALVFAEVTYLVGQRLGASTEAKFLRGLAEFEVEAPRSEDWALIASLVERYGDFPLSGTDASVVALAERLNTDCIFTLDGRHFRAVRMLDGRPFQLMPG